MTLVPERPVDRCDVVRRLPAFVLDHIGKPDVRNQVYSPWGLGFEEAGRFPDISRRDAAVIALHLVGIVVMGGLPAAGSALQAPILAWLTGPSAGSWTAQPFATNIEVMRQGRLLGFSDPGVRAAALPALMVILV